MGRWDVDWGGLLAVYAPLLLGLAALALICLAAWTRPPKWVRLTRRGAGRRPPAVGPVALHIPPPCSEPGPAGLTAISLYVYLLCSTIFSSKARGRTI